MDGFIYLSAGTPLAFFENLAQSTQVIKTGIIVTLVWLGDGFSVRIFFYKAKM
jgi:hypothetical protein